MKGCERQKKLADGHEGHVKKKVSVLGWAGLLTKRSGGSLSSLPWLIRNDMISLTNGKSRCLIEGRR